MNNRFYIDIETGPLDAPFLDAMKPEFVANRTLKDPEKIKADLAAKEAAWRDGAALDAMTGRVLCIGVERSGDFTYFEGDENLMLEKFWTLTDELFTNATGDQLIGFNIFGFDLPFLVRRSWHLSVVVPRWVRPIGKRWSETFIDLMDCWRMGNREDMASLDAIGRHIGLAPKRGSGKDFADLYTSNRDAAIQYLSADLERTKKLAERMIP